MSAVSSVRAPAPIPHEAVDGASAPGAPSPLLPEPDAATAGGMQDAMSLLYALITKLDDASRAACRQGVVTQTAAKKEEIKKSQEAIDKQIQAKKDADGASHGFWHSLGVVGKIVGDVAGVVAVAAASVVTFGAAAAVAVVAMSVTGAVLKETGLRRRSRPVDRNGALAGGKRVHPRRVRAWPRRLSAGDPANGISARGDVASGAGAVGNGVASAEIDHANADADDAVADQTRAQQQARSTPAVDRRHARRDEAGPRLAQERAAIVAASHANQRSNERRGVGADGKGAMSISAIGMGAAMPPSGDIGTEVAELALTTSTDQEKQAHLVRDGAEKVEDQAEQSQVAALHEKADEERSAATAAMVGGLVSGACSIGAGALELGDAIKTGVEEDAPSLIAHGAQWAAGAKGAGMVGSAIATKVSCDHKSAGADDDAKAAQLEHQAGAAKRAAEDASDRVKEARDHGNKAIDFLREYEATQAQTNAAALHRA